MNFKLLSAAYLDYKNWNIIQYTVLACIVVLCVAQIIKRENYRVQNYNIDVIDQRISQYKNELNQSFQLKELPDIREQWQYVRPIANHYGVKLSNRPASTYGKLPAWNGSVSGETPHVIAALRKLQTTVPTFITQYKISKGRMHADFSIVGKNN